MNRTFPQPIRIQRSNWGAVDRTIERREFDSPPTPWYLRSRKGYSITVPMAKGKKDKNDWAEKYCFSAKVQLYTHVGSPPSGIILAFDRNSDVVKQVEAVAATLIQDGGYICGQVELTMHRECPVEITDEVYVQLFDSERGTGSQDES